MFSSQRKPCAIVIARGDRIRHFYVRPWLAMLGVACVLLFATGYLAGTAYLFMRDDLVGTSMARETSLERRYELRIAALRDEMDKAKENQIADRKRQNAERANIEQRIQKLYRMQSDLASRGGLIMPLLDRARSVGLTDNDVPTPKPRPDRDAADASPALKAIDAATGATAALKPALSDAPVNAYLDSDAVQPASFHSVMPSATPKGGDPEKMVGQVAQSLRKLESDQLQKVRTLTKRAIKTAGAIRIVLDKSGVPMVQEASAHTLPESRPAEGASLDQGVGGPFIQLSDPTRFKASLHELNAALDRLESVRRKARKLPFGRPLGQEVVTSPFGARSDPFLDRAAFHPGVDLRAAYGTDVHATGAGTVTFAGADGGYGNMVEVDHGDGVSTRYGHLSKIDVTKGEHVAYGAVIGNSGSTGRSTGPHLHYEVRLHGHPVDPTRFLDTGLTLQALLRG